MKHVIFLIISSNARNTESDLVYSFMKDAFRKYGEPFRKNNPFCHFSYYFVEYSNEIQDEIVVTDDTILIKGNESVIPGIFIKTCNAIQYINENCNYDYLVRTNLSSLWNIPVLLEYLSTQTIEATGTMMFSSFLSGTGIILSKDVAVKFIQHVKQNKYPSIILDNHDDVLISYFLKMFVSITSLPFQRVCFLIDLDSYNKIPKESDLSDIFYFRIKTGDRLLDIQLFTSLMKKMYNIE